MFIFLTYKTLRTVFDYFYQIFSSHLFLMDNLFILTYIYFKMAQFFIFFAIFVLFLHDIIQMLQRIKIIYHHH